MKLQNFSLIYPDQASQERHMRSEDRPDISQYVVDELGLGEILELKNGSLPEFFTADPDVIA